MDEDIIRIAWGRKVKHPAMISKYKTINQSMVTDKPIKHMGIDFETDAKTGEVMLCGIYTDNGYFNNYSMNMSVQDFLFKHIISAIKNNVKIVHWTKFDENIIVKIFGEAAGKEFQDIYTKRGGRINGKWNYKDWEWEIPPYFEIDKPSYSFGIISLIAKKDIGVFYHDKKHKTFLSGNIGDVAQFYQDNIENTTKKLGLNWYTKIGAEYHIVDWKRFNKDKKFRDNVLLSNMYDAKAAKEIADITIKCFYDVWKCYPKRMTSTGTIGKMALEVELSKEDFRSIPYVAQKKNWGYGKNRNTNMLIEKAFVLACECYKGGMFETYAQGHAKECWIADISACYPAAMSILKDLRGSTIAEGYGPPPKPNSNQYIFIRGTVTIPRNAIHSLAVRNPDKPMHTIRPFGIFKTSYMWEERELLERQGGKFKNEYYIIINTKGKQSPVAKGSDKMFGMRLEHMEKGLPTQHIIKIANNSQYGILIEGVEMYKMSEDKAKFDGYSAGLLFNPFLAAIITAFGRVTLCTAMLEIRNNGGMIIQGNTDSIHWVGKKNALPKDFSTPYGQCGWREKKTRGYFEEPSLIEDFISISTGRYGGYDTKKKKYICKVRGYNVKVSKDSHYLKDILIPHLTDLNCTSIEIEDNRTLVSSKLAVIRKDYAWDKIGFIDSANRNMSFILANKCYSAFEGIDNPIPMLLKSMHMTEPFNAGIFRRTINMEMENLEKYYMENIAKLQMTIEEKVIKRKEKDRVRKQEVRKNTIRTDKNREQNRIRWARWKAKQNEQKFPVRKNTIRTDKDREQNRIRWARWKAKQNEQK